MGILPTISKEHRKLSLRSTLLLWNLGASLLFLLVGWLAVFFFSQPFGAGPKFLDPGFLERAAVAARDSTLENIRENLSQLRAPRGTTIALFKEDGSVEVLTGDSPPPREVGLTDAWNGHPNHRMVLDKSFYFWVPVCDGQGVVAIVAGFSFPNSLAPPTHLYQIVLALQAGIPATLVCLAVMFYVNRKLMAPLHKLANATRHLADSELNYRVKIEGPSEFSHLALAFNSMAEKLETTLEELKLEKCRVEELELSRREFMADISHNLGTPLSASQAWLCRLVEDDNLTLPERRGILGKVLRQLKFVAQTSKRLLELSRWEHSEPELYWEVFPIAEPLFGAVESVEEEALEQSIEMEFDQVGHYLVRGDRTRLREVFQIFFENAIKYAGAGASVIVSTVPFEGLLRVKVADNGEGMSPQRLARLGERFRSSPNGGSGLGLAIADQLLRAHHATLDIRSIEGKGTTITFSLPLEKGED